MDIVSAVKRAVTSWLPTISITGADCRAAQLPLLDVLHISHGSTLAQSASRAADSDSPAADALFSVEGFQQLTLPEIVIAEPPAAADLCPSEALMTWSCEPVHVADTMPPDCCATVLWQLLAGTGTRDSAAADAPRLSYSLTAAVPLAHEPDLEQLMLPPLSTALSGGPCRPDALLGELGWPAGVEVAVSVAETLSVMPPGCPTFEHFAALDLRLDRTQAPTLPLPEDVDALKAQRVSCGSPSSCGGTISGTMHNNGCFAGLR